MILKVARWVGIIAGACIALAMIALAVAYPISVSRLDRHYIISTPEVITVSRDTATIAHGHHLAETVVQCTGCHGGDMGGHVQYDSPWVMRVAGPNLTSGRGGVGADLSLADWEHAIRHGVGPNGRPLLLMPALAYVKLSDVDVAAIIAWAQQLPPVDRVVPPSRLGPIGHLMHITRLYPVVDAELLSPDTVHPAAAVVGVTPEYGKYLSIIAGCTDCHGEDLTGGRVPGSPTNWPKASNLTPFGFSGYGESDFIRALRTGRRPNGTTIDSVMPWPRYSHLTDDELRAIYAYLRTLPSAEPRAEGQ